MTRRTVNSRQRHSVLLRRRLLPTALLPLLALSSTGQAGTATWNLLSAGNATGSWATAGNWTTSDGTSLPPNGSDPIADFSTLDITADSTVSLNGNFTVNGLKFGDAGTASNNWIIAAGTPTTSTLTLAGTTPSIDVANQSATINATMNLSAGLTKTGAGTLILAANETIAAAGTININGGTLQVGAGGTTGSISSGTIANNPAISLAGGATLVFSQSSTSDLAINNALTGSGTLKCIGPGGGALGQGSFALGGNDKSLFNGTMIADKARIQAGTGTALGTAAVTALTGGGYYLNGGTYTNNFSIIGDGWTETTTFGQLGAIRLGGNAIVTGDITLTGDSRISAYGASGTIAGTIKQSSPGLAVKYGAVGVGGSQTLVLTGSSTYTGPSTLVAGTLTLSGTLGATAFTVNSGTTLGGKGSIGSGGSLTLGVPTVSSGATNLAVDARVAGTLTVGGSLTVTGVSTVALTLGSTITPGAPYPILNFTGGSTGATASNFALSGGTTPYRSVTFANTGSAITLDIANKALTWTGTPNLVWNASTNASPQNANWKDTSNAASTFYAGDFVMFDDSAGSADATVAVTGALSPASVTVNNSASVPYTFSLGTSGVLTGGTSLFKLGAGTLTIALSNSYTGGTFINGGTVSISNAGGVGNASTSVVTLANGTTLQSTVTGGVTATVKVDSPSVATLNLVAATSTAVPFAGNGTIKLSGSSGETRTFTLVANSTFTGTAQLLGGTYVINGANANWSGTTFQFANPTNNSIADTLSVTGTSTTATKIKAISDFYRGTLSIGTGATTTILDVVGGTISGPTSPTGTSTQVATIQGANANSKLSSSSGLLTFNLPVLPVAFSSVSPAILANYNATTPLSVTKTGDADLTLYGDHTYTGATLVTGGKVRVNGTLASGTNVTVGSTAASVTPGLAGTGTINGSVTLKGPGTTPAYVSGGHLAPGSNTAGAYIGTLNVGSLAAENGSVFDYEFNGAAQDLTLVASTGTLTLGAAGFNFYNENATTQYNFTDESPHHLIQYGSSATDPDISGLFVLNPVAGKDYTFSLGADLSGKYVDVAVTTATPEPGSLSVLGLGMVGLLRRRRPAAK